MRKPAIIALGVAFQFLVNCQSSDELTNSTFNPLRQPGLKASESSEANGSRTFKPGSYVTTGVHSTAFFGTRPTDGTTAELLLPAGTMMRVIQSDSSFTRVELDDGKIGFIATAAAFPQDPTGVPISPLNAIPSTEGVGTLPASSLGNEMALPPSTGSNGIPLPPIPATPMATPPLPKPDTAIPSSTSELPPSSVE